MWSSTDRTLHPSRKSSFHRRFKAPAAPEQMAGGEEKEDWEGDWDDEKAANGWYEGATVDPVVDLARCEDANGGSFGEGNPSTPRSGMRARDSSRSPRRKQGEVEDDGLLLVKDGEKENTGKKKK